MRILVLGATGMLGHQLLRRLHCDFHVSGTVRSSKPDPALSRLLPHVQLYANVNAEDLDSVKRAISDAEADVVINCIGLVKQAKDAPITSVISINALLPHQLAQLTAEAQTKLIHFSTDCVFSGARGPYSETDVPDPADLYGRSKLLGEVQETNALTLRLSIIGNELRGHRGLFEWFLSQKGGRVKGYANALYSGLTTIALADLIAILLRDGLTLDGIWHVSADPISKFELLQTINRIYGLSVEIERDEGFLCDRRLDSSRFRRATLWCPPAWDDMIHTMFAASEAAHVG